MTSQSLDYTTKAFHLTALSLALALSGCGGGDGGTVDSIAPAPDLGGNGNTGNNGNGNNNGNGGGTTTPETEADFFIQTITANPGTIQLDKAPQQFTIVVKAVQKGTGGAVANKQITVSVANSEASGVTIDGSSTQVTDDKGNATYTLILNPNAVADRQKLLNDGVSITATAKAADGSTRSQVLVVGVSEAGDDGSAVASDIEISSALQSSISSAAAINPYGDDVTVSVQAKTPKGASAQGVKIALGINNLKGVTILGGNNKETDANGNVTFNIKVAPNLNATERKALIQSGIAYNIKLTEADGKTVSKEGNWAVANPVSDYNLAITGNSAPLSAYGAKQTLTIKASPKSANVPTKAAGATVKVVLNGAPEGVSLKENTVTLNNNGEASVELIVAENLTLAQKNKLVADSISYTVTLTEPNKATTVTTASSKVYLPQAAYKVIFDNSDKKQLTSSGGTAVISFRVNDKNGGPVTGQKVVASLPSALKNSGLVTLDSAAEQTTDNKGLVSYTVRVPTGLTAAQKTQLEAIKNFALGVSITEGTGVVSTTASQAIDLIALKANYKVIFDNTDKQRISNLGGTAVITFRVNDAKGDAVQGQQVVATLPAALKQSGVVVLTSAAQQTTDASGKVSYTVSIPKNLTATQKIEIEKLKNFTLGVSIKEESGIVSTTNSQAVEVYSPEAAYKVSFDTSDKKQLTSSGGTAVISFRVNDTNGGPVQGQKVVASLPTALKKSGLVTLDSAAEQTTDNKGVVSYTVRVPTGLTTVQKTELEKIGNFVLGISITEETGVVSTTNSQAIDVVALKASYKVVFDNTDKQRISNLGGTAVITFRVNDTKGGPVQGQQVVANLPAAIKQSGVVVLASAAQQTTDANGKVSYTVSIPKNLTAAQKVEIEKLRNFTLGVSIKEESGIVSTTNSQAIDVYSPEAAYQVSFDKSDKKELTSSGGTAVISFRVNDTNGGPVAGQKVVASLPTALKNSGLVTLDSAAEQTTDNKGVVSYTVRVPTGLTAAQKTQLEAIKNFVLGVSITEETGVVSTTTSQAIDVVALKASYKVIFDNTDKQRISKLGGTAVITFRVNDTKGGPVQGQQVVATLPAALKQSGVVVLASAAQQTTDSSGKVSYTVSIPKNLTAAQKIEIEKLKNFTLGVSIKEESGIVSTTNSQAIDVYSPEAIYKVSFDTSDKKKLSSSGGIAVVSFRVNDKNGGPVEDQQVVASLPSALKNSGLVTLDSTAAQFTDKKGIVSYTIRIPAGLNASQKAEIEAIKSFALGVSITEETGVVSTTASELITVSSEVGKSDVVLTDETNTTSINVLGDTFTILAKAVNKSGGAVVTGEKEEVRLLINNVPGISISGGNTQKTNSEGIAEFKVTLSNKLTAAQKEKLVSEGINYTAVFIAADGTQSRFTSNMSVRQPASTSNIKSITASTVSELGGKSTVVVQLVDSKNANKPVVGQPVSLALTNSAKLNGVSLTQATATTDIEGKAIFVIDVATTLTAAQRTALKSEGITFQASYEENGLSYQSALERISVTQADVSLKVLNPETVVNGQAQYELSNTGDLATVKTQLRDNGANQSLSGKSVEFVLDNADFAKLITVNGQIGTSRIVATTDANGLVSFDITVPSNLTKEQRDSLNNRALKATLTETLTGKKQTVGINIKSTQAEVALVATAVNKLNLNGGEAQIQVVARDNAGNVVVGQAVALALPAAIAQQGIVIASNPKQTTNNSGVAIFTIAAPNGLTSQQKSAIGTTFPVGVAATDGKGNTVSQTVTVSTTKPSVTQEKLTLGANKVVNTEGDTFKVFARITDAAQQGVAGSTVNLAVIDPVKTGVTITGGNKVITNSDGVAEFNLVLTAGANVDKALLEKGIKVRATSVSKDGVTLQQDYIVNVDTSTIDSYVIMTAADKTTLNTGGDQTNVTFRIVDNNGGILTGVPVQISIDNPKQSGAALTTTSVVNSDAQGLVEAGVVLGAGSVNSRLNHDITVRAKVVTPEYDTSGAPILQTRVEEQVILHAEGTLIEVTASQTNVKPGEKVTVTTKLTDAAGRAIETADIELVNAKGDLVSANAKAQTNEEGVATFTLDESALAFDNNGNLRIFAKAIGEQSLVTQTSSQSVNLVQVSQAGISFSDIESVYNVNETNNINIQIRSDDPQSLVGERVEVQTTLGKFANNQVITSEVITAQMINGSTINVPVALTSDLAGISVLTASVVGRTNSAGEALTTTVDIRFRATTPAKMLLQPVKSVIAPGGSTEIVALIKDANDVPVEGITVVFSRAADSSAGRLSAATAVTNARGEAKVTYQANASSPINGVRINAEILNDTFSIGQKQTTITVSKEAVYTTLAFSDRLEVSGDNIYYIKNGSIAVMDGSGRPVANQQVSLKSYATRFAQGLACLTERNLSYQPKDTIDKDGVVTTPKVQLMSIKSAEIFKSTWLDTEDPQYNYILDQGDDVNGNGTLEAINPVTILGGTLGDDGYTFITDAEGKVDFQIRYPKTYSNWTQVRFDATTRLNGSENLQSYNVGLPALVGDVSVSGDSILTPYINNTSPFGIGDQVCINKLSVTVNAQDNTTMVSGSVRGAEKDLSSFLFLDNVYLQQVQVTAANPTFNYNFNQAFSKGATVSVVVGTSQLDYVLKTE